MSFTQEYQDRLEREQNDSSRKTRRHFTSKVNIDQDWDGIIAQTVDMAGTAWGRRWKGDAQIGQVCSEALTHLFQGIYMKRPRKAYWATGDYIDIGDNGASWVQERLKYATAGGEILDVGNGIVGEDDIPEHAVNLAVDWREQKAVSVKHKIHIKRRAVAKAALAGYDEFDALGRAVKEKHLNDLDKLIRSGSAKDKLTGMTNGPGVRQYVATQSWDAGDPSDILDEYVDVIDLAYASGTEEDVPMRAALARKQLSHFRTAQFSEANNDKLKQYIEEAYADEGHMIVDDPGMRAAVGATDPGPGALFWTPDPDFVFCTMPLYCVMSEPREIDLETIEIVIESRFFGVQMRDSDTVIVVDGRDANWAVGGA